MTPFNRPSVHSPTHPFTHPFIHPLIHSPTHPFTYPFIHPFIRSSTHPCIHVDAGGGGGGEGGEGGVGKGGGARSTESTSCSGYGWKLLSDRMVARFWWVVCIILPVRVTKCLAYTITLKTRWSHYWSPTLVHPSFWPATSRSWIWRRYQPALACSRWSVNQHFYFCPGLGWERL